MSSSRLSPYHSLISLHTQELRFVLLTDVVECYEILNRASRSNTVRIGIPKLILEPLETRLAMKRVCAYVSSLKTRVDCILITIYGSGEVPQSFCRLAVNRAIYKLREPVRGVAVDKTKHCRGVIIQKVAYDVIVL